jgi:hypothetical protein
MQCQSIKGVSIALLVYSLSAPGSAEQSTLAQCQAIKNKIDHYTQLRRAGGSAAKMDRWKRSRRAKEEAFDRQRCRRYRRELK